MRPGKSLLVLVVVLVLGVLTPTLGASAHGLIPGLPVHVGVGDSWTYGEGAGDPPSEGYFAVSHEQLREELDCTPAASPKAKEGCKHLQTMNVARPALPGRPGVTTAAVITEQLPLVLPLVADRNGDANPRNNVEVIYLSVGGNDVGQAPIRQVCGAVGLLDPACFTLINSVIDQVEVNYRVIMDGLRGAAGPDAPIVVVTYDNPIPFCDLNAVPGAALLGAITLEGGAEFGLPFIPRGLNDVIRGVAGDFGADVADTWGELGLGHWVGGIDCLHPNTDGHATIANIATETAIG